MNEAYLRPHLDPITDVVDVYITVVQKYDRGPRNKVLGTPSS